MTSLTEFLREKASSMLESDRSTVRQRYREHVQQLVDATRALLSPSEEDGTVSDVATTSVTLYEGRSDSYDAPSLGFRVGPSSLKLEPRGTAIVGAYGRVDLVGPKGEAAFVLLRDVADQKVFKWYLADRPKASQRPLMVDPSQPAIGASVVNRAVRPMEFNEESFLAALRYVLP